MLAGVRDALPGEELMFRDAVRSRNKEAFSQLFDLYPNVLWGGVSNTLSTEDRAWMHEILQEKEMKRSREENCDFYDY